MSIFGEEKASDAMVKDDIFTPLSALLKKVSKNIAKIIVKFSAKCHICL